METKGECFQEISYEHLKVVFLDRNYYYLNISHYLLLISGIETVAHLRTTPRITIMGTELLDPVRETFLFN